MAVGLSGCGKKGGTVKGKVTFNGIPLTIGTVSFTSKDRGVATGNIEPNGNYEVKNAPLGEVTITVQTPPRTMGFAQTPQAPKGVPEMPKDMMPADAQNPGKVQVVPAPDKYNKVETSDLKYSVESGTHEYNIVLKP